MKTIVKYSIIICFSFLSVYAQEVPYLSGRVVDNAQILSQSTLNGIETILKAFEDTTTNQIAVLTISSLEGYSIEDYSMRVVETWKLGEKGKDNGVLFLISIGDRKVRIEVGYGLEGVLTDAMCSIIIRGAITPHFKVKDYDAGVLGGVKAIISVIGGEYRLAEENATVDSDNLLAFLFFLVIVGIFTLLGMAAKGTRGWILYAFLMPFWLVFPIAFLGNIAGWIFFSSYLIGYPILKHFLRSTAFAGTIDSALATSYNRHYRSSGWWGGSGGWSSGGFGGFSGGGGSFGGGGASGSW